MNRRTTNVGLFLAALVDGDGLGDIASYHKYDVLAIMDIGEGGRQVLLVPLFSFDDLYPGAVGDLEFPVHDFRDRGPFLFVVRFHRDGADGLAVRGVNMHNRPMNGMRDFRLGCLDRRSPKGQQQT
jgi:hypothetical protein